MYVFFVLFFLFLLHSLALSPPRARMYFILALNTYVAGWVVPCLVEAYVGKDDHDYDLMLAPPNYKSHYAVFLHP